MNCQNTYIPLYSVDSDPNDPSTKTHQAAQDKGVELEVCAPSDIIRQLGHCGPYIPRE